MIPEVHGVGLEPYRKIGPMFRLYPGGLVVDAAELDDARNAKRIDATKSIEDKYGR
jgi:hypothetical protein